MEHRPVHLHSILVHAVVALAPLAAVCLMLEIRSATVMGIGPEVWAFLVRGSLLAVLVISVPAILTGISERRHTYVNWPPSHRIKLVASVVLVLLTAGELAVLLPGAGAVRLGSWFALAVVLGNVVTVAVLAVYGLRITLGRCSLARTSYRPDMDLEPPADILDGAAELAAEPARLVEVREEGR